MDDASPPDDDDNRSLPKLLTIIVTTSPIKSNPSTEVLEKTFNTFKFGGFEFAYKCKKVIICDGCRVLEEQQDEDLKTAEDKTGEVGKGTSVPKVSRKHANFKQALRRGIVTVGQAKNYESFKSALKDICRKANVNVKNSYPSPFQNTRVVELNERHGYGFALRHALRNEVSTPFVCVIQHDRTFMRTTPIEPVVQTMLDNKSFIKYVGMNMKSNLMYRDIYLSKYGKTACDELCKLVISPPQLALDSCIYGPEGSSIKNMQFQSESVKRNAYALAQTYKGTVQFLSNVEMTSKSEQKSGKHQLTLTPILFWYDNTHICETAHYRDFIFNPKEKHVKRGGFVEDKLSPVIFRHVEKLGLQQAHSKFGCYVLDDHSGFFFTGHLDGGSYMTVEEKQKLDIN